MILFEAEDNDKVSLLMKSAKICPVNIASESVVDPQKSCTKVTPVLTNGSSTNEFDINILFYGGTVGIKSATSSGLEFSRNRRECVMNQITDKHSQDLPFNSESSPYIVKTIDVVNDGMVEPYNLPVYELADTNSVQELELTKIKIRKENSSAKGNKELVIEDLESD